MITMKPPAPHRPRSVHPRPGTSPAGSLLVTWLADGAEVSDGSDDGDPGNPTVNFRGEKRTNATHQSITDPESRLYRKAAGQQGRLCHSAHALMENRNGLLVDVSVASAQDYTEREEALRMVRRTRARQPVKVSTLGADARYDGGPFGQEHRRATARPACGALEEPASAYLSLHQLTGTQ